jgi:putative glycerol-1-phosphate prenyltransferase
MGILAQIQQIKAAGRKGLAVLIDPDKTRPDDLPELMGKLAGAHVDLILVGGSLLLQDHHQALIPALKSMTNLPVVLFPGSIFQVHEEADALLYLSLISGRNPEMLIGNHVISAPAVRRSGLEVIPTGYMLIDSGRPTSVHYISNTLPIPYDKPDIAACTALAGELLGLRLIYMDAGSGAERSISREMIRAVHEQVNLPLVVGGGIRTAKQADETYRAGADLIVVGTAFEKPGAEDLIREISELIPVYTV